MVCTKLITSSSVIDVHTLLKQKKPTTNPAQSINAVREEPFKFLTHSTFCPDVWPQATGDEAA